MEPLGPRRADRRSTSPTDLPALPQVRPRSPAAAAPVVPGWQVRRPLGSGRTGTVWLAQDAAGGEAALKVLDPAVAPLLGAAVERLRAPASDALVAVRTVARAEDDRTVLVSERVAGGSLADLLAARGVLRAGEVASVVVQTAEVLAALHALGTAHGALSAGDLLLDAAGRVRVADWGLVAAATGGGADPVADVAALARTALAALDHQPGADGSSGLAGLLRAATTAPPPAAALARDVRALVEPSPVQLPAAALSPAAAITARLRLGVLAEAPPRGGSPRPGESQRPGGAPRPARPEAGPPARRRARGTRARAARRLLLGAGAAAAALLAGSVAALVVTDGPVPGLRRPTVDLAPARPSPVRPAAGAPAGPSAPAQHRPPTAAVPALASRRDRAVTAGDAALLRAVDAPGSPAEAADRAVVADLARRGVHVRDRATRVLSARRVPAPVAAPVAASAASSPGGVWVQVRARTSAYELVSGDGAVQAVAASGPVTSLLQLRVDAAGRWRVVATA